MHSFHFLSFLWGVVGWREQVALLSLAHGALVEESGLDDNLELVLLNDTTCLDGSSAGFYFRASGTNSSNWVIFLQGGGACYDQKSCSDRAKSALGSSTYWLFIYLFYFSFVSTEGEIACFDEEKKRKERKRKGKKSFRSLFIPRLAPSFRNATVRGNATYSADPAINPDFYQVWPP